MYRLTSKWSIRIALRAMTHTVFIKDPFSVHVYILIQCIVRLLYSCVYLFIVQCNMVNNVLSSMYFHIAYIVCCLLLVLSIVYTICM